MPTRLTTTEARQAISVRGMLPVLVARPLVLSSSSLACISTILAGRSNAVRCGLIPPVIRAKVHIGSRHREE